MSAWHREFAKGRLRRVVAVSQDGALDFMLVRTRYAYGGAVTFVPSHGDEIVLQKRAYRRSFGFPMVLHLWEEDTHVRFTSPMLYLEAPMDRTGNDLKYGGMAEGGRHGVAFEFAGSLKDSSVLEGLMVGRVDGEVMLGMERIVLRDALVLDFEAEWTNRALLWLAVRNGEVEGTWGTSADGHRYTLHGSQILPRRMIQGSEHRWQGPQWSFLPSVAASMNERFLFLRVKSLCESGLFSQGREGVFIYGEYGA